MSCSGGPGQRCVDECSENMDDHIHPSHIYHRLTERLDEVRTIVVLQSCPAYSRRLICLLDLFIRVIIYWHDEGGFPLGSGS